VREADADDEVEVLADEGGHVRDVVRWADSLDDTALDAELPLRLLQAAIGELVEAAVVQLPLIREQPDLESVARVRALIL
jgi:hypothetical protein